MLACGAVLNVLRGAGLLVVIRKLPKLTVDGPRMRFRTDFDLLVLLKYWILVFLSSHAQIFGPVRDGHVFVFLIYNRTLYQYCTINERERSGTSMHASHHRCIGTICM